MLRPLWLSAALCLGVGCESGAPKPASSDAPPPSGSKAPLAVPDAPIDNGARVPPAAEGKSLDDVPDPAAASSLTQAMSRLAQRYLGGWIAASPAFDGELAEGQYQDYQLLLGSARCYRVLGVAERSFEDLDLLLFDPSGVQVQEDQGSDRFPVVGLGYPVCPPRAGAYRLQVRAPSGSGRFRVQAFHTP